MSPSSKTADSWLAFVWAWEKGISLFSIVRGTGPLSPMLVGKYSNNRFGSQDEEVKRDLHAYFYAISMLKGSGEYCICESCRSRGHDSAPETGNRHGLK